MSYKVKKTGCIWKADKVENIKNILYRKKTTGLPWGWHFNPHTYLIPTGIPIGIPMGIPIPTAALENKCDRKLLTDPAWRAEILLN